MRLSTYLLPAEPQPIAPDYVIRAVRERRRRRVVTGLLIALLVVLALVVGR